MASKGMTRREVVQGNDNSSRVVTETAAFTASEQVHAGRTTLLSLLAGFTVTLPPAIGSGAVYRFHVGIVRTSGNYIIQVDSSNDNMEGLLTLIDTDSVDNSATGFVTTSNTSVTITLDATIKGGLTIGDWVELVDAAANVWHVHGQLSGSGTIETPFSAAV